MTYRSKEKKFFILFASCVVVQGIKRSTICDLQRGDLYFLPNQAAQLITELKTKEYQNVISKFNESEKSIVEEYVEYFIENDLGFWCNDLSEYPDIEMVWDSPESINNAIIEVSLENTPYLSKLTEELISLRCKSIEIRVYNYSEGIIQSIQKILNKCNDSCVRYITICIEFDSMSQFERLLELGNSYKRLNEIIIHNTPVGIKLDSSDFPKVYSTNQKITDATHCGIVSSRLFAVNLVSFSESLHFNSCLNRKVSISGNGDIKNCPLMTKVYGNVKTDRIDSVVKEDDFKKVWSVTKDQVEICNVCEFRYVCTDCRAYVDKPENLYSKPLKCGYNPYEMEWNDWREQDKKLDVIRYYNIDFANSTK